MVVTAPLARPQSQSGRPASPDVDPYGFAYLRLALALAGDQRLMTPGLFDRGLQMYQQARTAGLDLAPVAIAPQFAGVVDVPAGDQVFRGMPLGNDPTWKVGGDFAAPPEVHHLLQCVRETQIPLQNLYIWHELSAEVAALPYGEAERYMTPPPERRRLLEAQRLGAVAETVSKLTVGALLGVGAVALGAAAVTATAGAALAGGLALSLLALDPVLMGVVVDPDSGVRAGAPALWVPLAAWRY